MTVNRLVHPPADTWVASIHLSEDDYTPIGTAVVIDADRLLTCGHVVVSDGGEIRQPLWVSFAKVDRQPRRRVASVVISDPLQVKDLALLTLQEPAPAGVEAAPLRRPKPGDLINKAWWAFGFPDSDPYGDSASGVIGAGLAHGWIRLDTESRYLVRPGFSGGGLWSPDYQAVVGIVGQVRGNGDGRAITLHEADLCFPDQELAALASWSARLAGEVALQQWGWTLDRDPEDRRHWRPRARGVSIESERGYRFRGRTSALTQIVRWLDRPQPDRQVLVVTGSPGVGKSAVLGRIVTTADPAIRASLPDADDGVKASLLSVNCAVHAKGKTALEIAQEIARAGSVRLPAQLNDLVPAIRSSLGERRGRRFNVIIDALDEAATPEQARATIDMIVLPLVETCSDIGVQVIVGTRRRDDGGELLDRFGGALTELDLDSSQYFAEEDLAAYALACLQFAGDERQENPYADNTISIQLADRIAALSGQNFLVAGLIARSHGLHDKEAADPGQLAFTTTVDTALADYLRDLSPVAGLSASVVLTALAFAEAPGLPIDLWQLAIEAISGKHIGGEDLTRFARSAAANFLVETGGAVTTGQARHPARIYRLFHQALNDALLRARSGVKLRAEDERSIVSAFIRHGQPSRWQDVPSYMLRSLPRHADIAGVVDDLLSDDAYLLHADLRRLLQVADSAHSAPGRDRAKLLRLTPLALTATPQDRAALFSVTEALENLGKAYRDADWKAPYCARWASVKPRKERVVLEGHAGQVHAVCSVVVAGRQLLASAGADGTVRTWDPQTGERHAVLKGHQGSVYAVCSVVVAGRQLLASAGADGTVRTWDPQTAEQSTTILKGHKEQDILESYKKDVHAVCSVVVAGRQLLASAGADGTVRTWDPQTGERYAVLKGHQGSVYAVCSVVVAGRQLLASAGADGTVRTWDPQTAQQSTILKGHKKVVYGVCSVVVAGRQLLASAGADGTVRTWDPQTGEQYAVLQAGERVRGVCSLMVAGRQLLANVDDAGMVRISDPKNGEQLAILESRQGQLTGECSVEVGGRQLLASAGADGTVRIWDPETAEHSAVLEGHQSGVNGVCSVVADGRELLASADADRMVRIWDPQTGEQRAVLIGHTEPVAAVCSVEVGGQELLASGGYDGRLRTWDPETGEQRAIFRTLWRSWSAIKGVCVVMVDDQQLLASAGNGGAIRIRDPRTGQERAVLKKQVSHSSWDDLLNASSWGDLLRGIPWDDLFSRLVGIGVLCPVIVNDRQLLASAGDGPVRIWDLQTGELHTVLKDRYSLVNGMCSLMVHGEQLLVCANNDGTVGIWDPQTGELCTVLEGHRARANGVCSVVSGGRQLLASASSDRTVRIWDPETKACLLIMPTHYTALAVEQVAGSLAIGLKSGILMISISIEDGPLPALTTSIGRRRDRGLPYCTLNEMDLFLLRYQTRIRE